MTSYSTSIAAIAVAALISASPLWAMAQTAPDPHHPSDGGAAVPDAQAPVPQPGMMGMIDMMRMMQMMHQGNAPMPGMRMQSMDMAGMPATDHIEGRIAFLKAEIKITGEQSGAWDAFADALRLQARHIEEARKSIGQSTEQPGLEQRLVMQEMLLTACLDGIRAVKAAFARLDSALSEEQRRTAEDLLEAHMGMKGRAMMPSMGSVPMESTAP